MPLIEIVIAHYGTGALTAMCLRCLESIRLHSSDYRLIFVDNGSPEFEAVRGELDRHPHLLIRNTENIGFIRATNQGLAVSTAPYIVLLNNDTWVVPGWLVRLRLALDETADAGLAGPLTTTPDSWQGRWNPAARPMTTILSSRSMLAFFCVMIKRRVIDSIGMLNEDFGAGFGDDDEYCYRAQRAGFKLVLAEDLVIPHHHRQTFKQLYTAPEIAALQAAALAKFRRQCPSV